jgi:biopolymer transport protein ExbD
MKTKLPSTRINCLSGWPDLTPLVDVLFLLLIFFMLSSSFVQVSGIKVDLPEVGSTSTLGAEKFIITVVKVKDKWEINFNDQVVSPWEGLKQKLADVSAMSSTATIILRADEGVPFGVVAKIMVLAEKSNLSVFIATVAEQKKNDTIFEPSAK